MREEFSVSELCETLEVSRSGFYKYCDGESSNRERENQEILAAIEAIRQEPYKDKYGSPRMTIELQNRGISCSENRVARIMAKAKIDATASAKFKPKTTVPDTQKEPSPNLVKDQTASKPGEILINDITYVATKEGWLYLAVTIDLFTRQVLGWTISENMKAKIVVEALDKASTHGIIGEHTIYHSDRGSQYTSKKLRNWLKIHKISQSMSALGYCYDNAACESFFSTLKREAFPDGCVFENRITARREIFKYIETFYNRERILSLIHI